MTLPRGINPISMNSDVAKALGEGGSEFIRQWNLLLKFLDGLKLTDAAVEEILAAELGTTSPIAGGGTILDFTPISHNDTAVTPDTYGDATHVPQFTVDQKGHITGAAEVPISFPTPAIPSGGSASRSTNQALTGGADTLVQFTTEDYDDAGFITLGTSNTKITIPTGYTRAIVFAFVQFDNTAGNKFMQIKKNGNFVYQGEGAIGGGIQADRYATSTGYMQVTAGDFFELNVNSSLNRNVTVSYFSIIAW